MRVLMLSLDRGLLGLAASGDVLTRHQRYADAAGVLDVIVFSPAAEDRVYAPNFRVFSTNSSRIFHFRAAAALGEKLWREKPYDLLVTQEFASPAGVALKKMFHVPWIINVHGMFFDKTWLGANPVKWYLTYRIKKALNHADGFRVNNEQIKKQLLRWGVEKPILVQPTPIDINKFKIQNAKVKMTNQNVKLQILYVGRLSPEKNVALLIRAFRKIENEAELWIVGAGPEENKLRALAAEDQRIKFFGAKTSDELAAIYREADILVLPSNTESFGKVLIEAGAAGCVLVSTRTPGPMGIIEDGKSGLFVDVGDEPGLTAALEKLLGDGGLRTQLAKGAMAMAENYDYEQGVSNTINFWNEIAAARVRASQ